MRSICKHELKLTYLFKFWNTDSVVPWEVAKMKVWFYPPLKWVSWCRPDYCGFLHQLRTFPNAGLTKGVQHHTQQDFPFFIQQPELESSTQLGEQIQGLTSHQFRPNLQDMGIATLRMPSTTLLNNLKHRKHRHMLCTHTQSADISF